MRMGWMLALVVATACGSNNTKPGVDAAMPDAPPPLTEVHGTAGDLSYASATAPVSQLRDLSGYIVQAYVPDSSTSGFRILDAGAKTTSFTIPGVPAGAYYLVVVAPDDPAPHFYLTTARTLDLGEIRLGRAGAAATQPTPLTFHLSGMDPSHGNDDRIFVDSFSTAAETNAFVPTGGTALDPFVVDWRDLAAPLLDAGKADDLYVVHQRRVTEVFPPESITRTIIDTFSTTSLTLVNGQPASVTGTFKVPTVSATWQAMLDPASFLLGLDVPATQPMAMLVRIRAGFTGAFSQGVPLVEIGQTFRAAPQSAFRGGTYLDPYPADWPRFVFVSPGVQWSYVARGTLLQTTLFALTFDRKPLTASTIQVVAPFAAPHDIKVGGVATRAARAVPFDGSHPVAIEWAPVVGITHYQVIAMRLTANGAAAQLATVATADTFTTSVTLPATVFTVGGSYVFSVAAIRDLSVDYAAGALVRQGYPVSRCEAVTARLLFASSCGNGTADAPYEDCDASGAATKACNPDCTFAVCGDGFTSTAAGEQCDDAGESVTCNADCTLAACGDGHLSRTRGEQCDDGNTANGDGCSATCTLEPGGHCSGTPERCGICGNSVVEVDETCDRGFAQNGQPGSCCSSQCQVVPPAPSCP